MLNTFWLFADVNLTPDNQCRMEMCDTEFEYAVTSMTVSITFIKLYVIAVIY